VDNHAPLATAWQERTTLESAYFTSDGALHGASLTPPRRLLRWLRYHVYTAEVLARVWTRRGHAGRIEVGPPPGESPKAERAAWRVPLGLYLPPDAVWRDAWTVTGHAVVALKRAVEARGSRLAAFVIPDRRQLGGEAWSAALADLRASDRARADRDRPQRAMLALLEQAHVPAQDLLPVFRAAPPGLYLPGDGHFTPAGHAVTAEALAAWLRDTSLVPGRPRVTSGLARRGAVP
jgi:hypothetical protein